MGNWCLAVKGWETDTPIEVVREWGCECGAATLSELGDILVELEGVADDAWGLIEVKDGLV